MTMATTLGEIYLKVTYSQSLQYIQIFPCQDIQITKDKA